MSTPTKPISPLEQLKVYRMWGTTIAVVTFVVFTSILITFDVSPHRIMSEFGSQEQIGLTTWNRSDTDPMNGKVAVQALIAKLRAATTRARSGSGNFTGERFNRTLWNQENPCLSRSELPQRYSRRKSFRNVEPNLPWRAVLREYAKLHRTCMQRVGNVTDYFLSNSTSLDCKFTIVDADKTCGLGNRMIVVASAVMYSILTQRVVLLAGDEDFIPRGLMCEPFEGSSWKSFDPWRQVTPYKGPQNKFWIESRIFDGVYIDAAVKEGKVVDNVYAVANYDVEDWFGQPLSRFYCDEEQKHYQKLPFLYLTGMIYFLPKLFSVPSFRPVLDELFPDRMVLTTFLREVMLPSDEVWASVKRMDRGYLENADRRVGIHMRYRYGQNEYAKMHDTAASRVWQCAIENGIFPAVAEHESNLSTARKPLKIIVLVASLYEAVKWNLTETFIRHPTVTGDIIQVVQLSSEGSQKFGAEIFRGALAEALILSFSDYLFVTPISTYSGLAQAYGGLKPWFIDWRDEGSADGACTRGQTVDVCFQNTFDYDIKCPYDPTRNNKSISEVYPDIQKCLEVDVRGVQLITTLT